jgi:hypothetical protein
MQVLDAAYLVVGALCTFIGAAGYYMYGNGALDVITFNLPKVTRHSLVLPRLSSLACSSPSVFLRGVAPSQGLAVPCSCSQDTHKV